MTPRAAAIRCIRSANAQLAQADRHLHDAGDTTMSSALAAAASTLPKLAAELAIPAAAPAKRGPKPQKDATP